MMLFMPKGLVGVWDWALALLARAGGARAGRRAARRARQG